MARDDSKSTKERVEVFDKEWDWRYRKRHDDGSFIWGVILLVAGFLFLLNSLGIVSWNVWNYIWQFWPVVLILWGVQVILGRNPFSRFIVGVLALIIVGLIVIFGITKVNPAYKQNFPPQVNNVINQMNSLQQKGNLK